MAGVGVSWQVSLWGNLSGSPVPPVPLGGLWRAEWPGIAQPLEQGSGTVPAQSGVSTFGRLFFQYVEIFLRVVV